VVAVADLAVIIPSRQRPTSVAPLVEAFRATCTTQPSVYFAVDADDPTLPEYIAVVQAPAFASHVLKFGLFIHTVEPRSMVHALNETVRSFSRPPLAIAFMGDDHMPRTVGWDAAYLEALRALGTGMVYGNDLLQGQRLPTQIAMTSDIVKALGYMAPPELLHLYVDNFWLDLGRQAGCIRYLPDVVVEHRHPVAGKAAWDEGYARVNDASVYAADGDTYAQYAASLLPAAVAKVKALRGAE
jgi:hypothetical protein